MIINRLTTTTVAIGSCALTVAVFAGGVLVPPQVAISWDQPPTDSVPSAGNAPQSELLLVFIGSPTCAASNAPGLPALIAESKQFLFERARGMNRQFASMAVVQSQSTDSGIRFLRRFSRFDELAVGRSWLNAALDRYVYREHEGAAATPQLLVVQRAAEPGVPHFTHEEVVLRLVGYDQIESWVRAGAKIPGGENNGRRIGEPPGDEQ